MSRVVHFEISADDMERAKAFYEAAFGWTFNKWGGEMPYYLVNTGEDGPGINGGMFGRMGPMTGHVNTVSVDDLDSALSRIEAAGGEVVVPRMAIPTIGWQAYCKDTEGSIFGVHQMDPNAA